MIDRADLDNDGVISEEEFYQIMTRISTKVWKSLIIELIK